MGFKRNQGKSGNARNYITRTQAVRKLQISLPDFRRLCIFKGIYPREPTNRKKASKSSTPSTTFYYAKDIQYLLHEPLINRFREHKALAKKIGKALGRGEDGDAVRLERNKTRMTLDHVIKERYPTFVDALRDLDDALSMLFLFANLPSTAHVPPKTIALCQRLCLEFEHYLIVTKSLRKSFLSIKGIYYQVTIQGQDILWLVPYRFVQKMQGDIDFRIMSTFVEFYTTLLGFVNHRLFSSVGLVYPPKFNRSSDDLGGELGAFQLQERELPTTNSSSAPVLKDAAGVARQTENAQLEADRLLTSTNIDDMDTTAEENGDDVVTDVVATDAIDKFETVVPEQADSLPQPEASDHIAATLFAPFTFYLSRETPRAPLEFILKAFSCKRVGWDVVLGDGAFTTDESDPAITHQIVDRPNLPSHALPLQREEASNGNATVQANGASAKRIPGRTYVQPQWVWDSINQGKLLRPDLYGPGASLPPHLSPWVKPKKGAYDPTLPLAGQEKEDEAELHEEDFAAEEELEANQEEVDLSGSEDDSQEDPDEEESAPVQDEDWDGFEAEAEELSDDELSALNHQRELEAEALGQTLNTADAGATPGKAVSETRKKAERRERAEKEELDRRRMMLPNKKRRLFDSMTYSNAKKDVEAEKLRKKRRKLEKLAPPMTSEV